MLFGKFLQSGPTKYLDWAEAQRIVDSHPQSVILAGLFGDWDNTSGLIFANGEYHYERVYDRSAWATPALLVDGEEIPCYTTKNPTSKAGLPDWWGNGCPIDPAYYAYPYCEYDEEFDNFGRCRIAG